MKRASRISFFEKLAKKDTDTLKGKYNRKDLLKYLEKVKSIYSTSRSQLKNAEKKMKELEKDIESNKDALNKARDMVTKCHEFLKNMDFAGAEEVHIKDTNDVAYVIDGKKMSYNSEDGSCEPYTRKKKDKNDTFDVDSDDSHGEKVEDNTLHEGVEINLGA